MQTKAIPGRAGWYSQVYIQVQCRLILVLTGISKDPGAHRCSHVLWMSTQQYRGQGCCYRYGCVGLSTSFPVPTPGPSWSFFVGLPLPPTPTPATVVSNSNMHRNHWLKLAVFKSGAILSSQHLAFGSLSQNTVASSSIGHMAYTWLKCIYIYGWAASITQVLSTTRLVWDWSEQVLYHQEWGFCAAGGYWSSQLQGDKRETHSAWAELQCFMQMVLCYFDLGHSNQTQVRWWVLSELLLLLLLNTTSASMAIISITCTHCRFFILYGSSTLSTTWYKSVELKYRLCLPPTSSPLTETNKQQTNKQTKTKSKQQITCPFSSP